jgi:threonine dehydrogenase-like Zn-dependent dehydrogenase
VSAVANKLVDTKALITHRFPLAKLEEAIKAVANRQGNVLKAVITS